jgi:DNA-binding MarR family transcriptional regulator
MRSVSALSVKRRERKSGAEPLSHHLARMQRRGLVAREECPSDRRGAIIALTDSGRGSLVNAAPHVDTVRKLLFDHLDADSLAALDRISSGLLARLDEQDALPSASGVA